MKTSLALFCLFFPFVIYSQTNTCDGGRFYDELYQVEKTSNIVYGENDNFFGQSQTLRFDLYEPQGDTLEKRPLIIWAFGGSFLFGDKLSPDIVRLSNEFASRGYVCASIDYRIFFYPINQEQTLKAVVRATHDMKAAIRFFRKDAATDNLYNIDPDRIFVGGVSAGGITAVQVGYLNLTEEIPAAIAADSTAFGGIEGVSGTQGYPSNPNLIINLCGAVGDTNWIVPGDIPIVSLHGTADGTVPYGSQEIEVTGTPIGFFVDGSGSLHARASNIGIDNYLHTWYGVGHTPFISTSNGSIDEDYMDTVVWTVRDFMQPYACREINTVGINTVTLQNAKLYPNPANEMVSVEVPKATQGYMVTLQNVQGQTVRTYAASFPKLSFSTDGLDAGIYIITISMGGEQLQKRLVVY